MANKWALVDTIKAKNTPSGNSRTLYRFTLLDTVKPYRFGEAERANAETVYRVDDGTGWPPLPKGYQRVNGAEFYVSPSDWRQLAKQAEAWTWAESNDEGVL